MSDAIGKALDQLCGYGLEIEYLDLSGQIKRVRHRDDKANRKDGWYVAHELRTRAGEALVVGAYGWWKDEGGPYRISASTRGLSAEDRQELQRHRREAETAAKAARDEQARAAAERSARIWEKLPKEGRSEYLTRKGIRAFGLRFARGSVVVPLRTPAGVMTGLQWIGADGAKRFVTGTAKQGACHLIGSPEPGQALAVAEGYATAASIHQATGWPCAVAFDAGNLRPVCEALHAAYPRCRFVVCGDDDHATRGNPGRAKAETAAKAVAGRAVFPAFSGARGTDWNDLHAAEGIGAVRAQLEEALKDAEASPPSPPGVEGEAFAFPFDLGVLLRDYVLIYGTETVYDGRIGRVVNLSGLRAAAGKGLVRIWLEHPERRLVMPECVVFDPAGREDPRRTVNLFRGWEMRPKVGSCARLLELLHYLCGESENVTDWVLRWAAYPLQHPGAKMRTAIVMHGPEGTGKNTFWGAIRDIYGEYGAIISQSELESQFNGWASRKLFVIGNEVVSRQEMYHQKGRIKNMITEPEWAINEKMMPVRMEANHANFVFFSNALQPATPDPDDRRMMVIWTPPALDEAFYLEVAAEIRNGGVQALYRRLLDMDLAGFSEHTKPIGTQAKDDLIDASMDNHERFFRQWRNGDLPISYRPCRSMDLYRAYRKWCDERGERNPAREAVFSAAMCKRIDRRVQKFINGSGPTQKTCFFPPGWVEPAEKSLMAAVGEEVAWFAQEYEQWQQTGS